MRAVKSRYKWTPLVRSTTIKPMSDDLLRRAMERMKVSREEAERIIMEYADKSEIWINDIYQVQRRVIPPDNVHLNIRRRDGGPILRDWRHFQQIKNELIGPECEAVELYPAESRLVDTSNKFHLWGVLDPTFRFPLGFEERDVQYEGSKETPGMRQRPL